MDAVSRHSSAPSTVAAPTAAASPFGGGDAAIERLCFTFQLSELRVRAPHKLPAHHSFYIKWVRGRSFRGKFSPVACPVSTDRDGVHVTVPLPAALQFSFEVNMHYKSGDRAAFERKLMEVSVSLFRFTDEHKCDLKSRALVADSKIDLRSLLVDVRVNAPMRQRLPLSDTEYIDCTLLVAPAGLVQPAMETGAPALASASLRATLHDVAPTTLQFAPSGDGAHAAGVAQATVQRLAESRGLGESFSPMADVLDRGMSRAVVSEHGVLETFQLLSGDCGGEFSSMLHAVRGDTGYIDTPWLLTAGGTAGLKSVDYQLRLAKDNYCSCQERTVMCAVGEEVFAHSSSRAPDVPVIGSACRLECLLHIAPSGMRGSVVAFFAFLRVPSDTLRRMVGAKADRQLERLVLTAEQVLIQILQPRASRARPRSSRASRSSVTRFRRSLGGRSTVSHSSLDPNLWRRLVDHGTLPFPHLVLQYLQRLQHCAGASSKTTEQHITALESVVVYHRQSEPIVRAVLGILSHACRGGGGGAAVVASFSPTLSDSLRAVVELHEPGTFGDFEPLLLALERETEKVRHHKLDTIHRHRRYWQALADNIAQEDVVVRCLEAMIESRTHIVSTGNLPVLDAALSLHLGSEAVCLSIFQILSATSDHMKLPVGMATAMERAGALHPLVALRFPSLLERAAQRVGALTPFEARFGVCLSSESPRFECNVVVVAPTRCTGRLFITRTNLCVGPFCVALSSVRRIATRRVMLQPALSIYTSATAADPEYVLITWARRDLLQELSDMGYYSLIQR